MNEIGRHEKVVTYLTAVGLDVAQERGHVDIELRELFVAYVMTMPNAWLANEYKIGCNHTFVRTCIARIGTSPAWCLGQRDGRSLQLGDGFAHLYAMRAGC